MSDYTQLTILTKLHDMAKYAYPALTQFPKSEKFAIVVDIKRCTALKMRRRLRKLQKDYAAGAVDWPEVKMSLASYNGMLKHCDSYRLTLKIFGGSTEDGTVGGVVRFTA